MKRRMSIKSRTTCSCDVVRLLWATCKQVLQHNTVLKHTKANLPNLMFKVMLYLLRIYNTLLTRQFNEFEVHSVVKPKDISSRNKFYDQVFTFNTIKYLSISLFSLIIQVSGKIWCILYRIKQEQKMCILYFCTETLQITGIKLTVMTSAQQLVNPSIYIRVYMHILSVFI